MHLPKYCIIHYNLRQIFPICILSLLTVAYYIVNQLTEPVVKIFLQTIMIIVQMSISQGRF